MISIFLKWLLGDLVTDPKDCTVSHTRVGMLIAGATFTAKMLVDMPDDWALWLVYLGTVGGYGVARQWLSSRQQPATGAMP